MPKKTKRCPHCGSVMRPSRPSDIPELTDRQVKVLQGIANGRTCAEIAEELKISRRTAEFHRMMLMQKLRLHSTAELTLYALDLGLV